MSDEHLSTEEISALLDRGAERASETGHLEECSVCRREMDLLRRMRMALSALDDRQAPPDGWTSIEAELEEREVVEPDDGGGSASGPVGPFSDLGWPRAAAAVLLFAGGLGLGTVLSSSGALSPGGARGPASAGSAAGGPGPDAAVAGAPGEDAARSTPLEGEAAMPSPAVSGPTASPSGGGEAAAPTTREARTAAADVGAGAAEGTRGETGAGLSYREAMERLEALRARGPSFREAYRNPAAAAEHLARLDALMRASQEALRQDPADPALNDFLFQVAEERRVLDRALQLSSLEYR